MCRVEREVVKSNRYRCYIKFSRNLKLSYSTPRLSKDKLEHKERCHKYLGSPFQRFGFPERLTCLFARFCLCQDVVFASFCILLDEAGSIRAAVFDNGTTEICLEGFCRTLLIHELHVPHNFSISFVACVMIASSPATALKCQHKSIEAVRHRSKEKSGVKCQPSTYQNVVCTDRVNI